jgi:transcriptional regulator with XRE-family HTH domain
MGSAMADTWGDVLRWIREASGLSHAGLAGRAYVSAASIGHAETGRRRPTGDLAHACDQALGTTPLLALLHDLDRSDMRRRALIRAAGAVAGVGGSAGLHALAEVVRDGLAEVSGGPDWDTMVADYGRRLVIDPSAAYGSALLASLMLATEHLRQRPTVREPARAAAHLAQLYGLWQGGTGQTAAARGWYRSAAALADRSTDVATAQYVRARAASRAVLEGYTARETIADAQHALALTTAPTEGALEARSALAHVHGLTGRTPEARREVATMRRLAEQLPGADQPGGAHQRVVTFANWVEARCGRRAAADRAWAEADPILREIPVWHSEAAIYYGRALVADGDVHDGAQLALTAVRRLTAVPRPVGVAVRDLLSAAPAGAAGDELDELRQHAAPGPMPWETLAV